MAKREFEAVAAKTCPQDANDEDTANEDESEDDDDESESDEESRKKPKVDDSSMESSDDDKEEDEDEDEDEKFVDLSKEKELANSVLAKVLASSKAQGLEEPQPPVEIEVKKAAKTSR